MGCDCCWQLGFQDEKTGERVYRASSPDEEALVKAARALGYDFTTPAPIVNVNLDCYKPSHHAKYEILNVNEFNSSRYLDTVTPFQKVIIAKPVICLIYIVLTFVVEQQHCQYMTLCILCVYFNLSACR